MPNPNTLKPILQQLVSGRPLTRDQAYTAFERVMGGEASQAQIGSLLTALTARPGGPSVDEITGAAQAMREHAVAVDVPPDVEVIDTCGTGGDHTGTFNISTAAALIAAGAGARVAKHGNRSVTSCSGSSQVLEALGVNVQATGPTLSRALSEAGICFCFAPTHHPAMKHAVGPRRELGFRTIFNLLGPLTNPARAGRQVVGVYDPHLVEPIARVLANLGATHAMVVHGESSAGGLDEITTTGPTHIATARGGRVTTSTFEPESVGVERIMLDQLKVQSVEESAATIQAILSGEPGPPRDIAALNAAAALVVADLAENLSHGLALARRAIDDGAAKEALERLVEVTHGDNASSASTARGVGK